MVVDQRGANGAPAVRPMARAARFAPRSSFRRCRRAPARAAPPRSPRGSRAGPCQGRTNRRDHRLGGVGPRRAAPRDAGRAGRRHPSVRFVEERRGAIRLDAAVVLEVRAEGDRRDALLDEPGPDDATERVAPGEVDERLLLDAAAPVGDLGSGGPLYDEQATRTVVGRGHVDRVVKALCHLEGRDLRITRRLSRRSRHLIPDGGRGVRSGPAGRGERGRGHRETGRRPPRRVPASGAAVPSAGRAAADRSPRAGGPCLRYDPRVF